MKIRWVFFCLFVVSIYQGFTDRYLTLAGDGIIIIERKWTLNNIMYINISHTFLLDETNNCGRYCWMGVPLKTLAKKNNHFIVSTEFSVFNSKFLSFHITKYFCHIKKFTCYRIDSFLWSARSFHIWNVLFFFPYNYINQMGSIIFFFVLSISR